MKDGHLESKDLMIGDWVLFRGHSIHVNFPMLESINCGVEVEPVHLTPEILEKNGWHFDDLANEWYSNNKAPNLYGRDCGNLSMFYGSVVGNVNKLQHALRLCGRTDLADNFKV